MSNQFGAVTDRGLTDAVTKRLGTSPDLSLSLSPELAVTMDLGPQSELFYHMGWRRWSLGVGYAAVAAVSVQFQFQNPPAVAGTKGSIIIIESLNVVASANDFLFIGQPGIANNLALTTPRPVHAILDTRQSTGAGAIGGGQLLVSDKQVAPVLVFAGANGATFGLLANQNTPIPITPIVLMPGGTVIANFSTVNINQAYNLVWRERIVNEAENAP